MNDMVQNMTGMGAMTDQVLATDLLMAAKSGIKNCAWAISESATPEVRDTLQQQLIQAIQFHGQVTDYMISKGYYHPYDMSEQFEVDMNAAQTALTQASQSQAAPQ